MDVLIYSAFSVFTFATFFLIWRRCGVLTCEGLCALFHFSYVFSDFINLIFQYLDVLLFDGSYSDFDRELGIRLYPSIYFFIAFLTFLLGILSANYLVRGRRAESTVIDNFLLRRHALLFFFMGFLMYLLAWISIGVTSLSEVWDNLMNFATQKGNYGFLGEGLMFLMIGLSLLTITSKKISSRFIFLFILIVLPILFSPSRSGIQLPILVLAITTWYFNRQMFWSYFRMKTFLILVLIYAMSVAIKAPYKYGTDSTELTYESVREIALSALEGRYGGHGIFYAYTILVDNVSRYPHLSGDGAALYFGIITVIPRLIWNDKPYQPTIGLGWLTEDSKSVISDSSRDADESVTLTLPGMWFWDFQYWGITLGMFCTGFLLRMITVLMSTTLGRNMYPCAFIWWCAAGQLFGGYSSIGYILVYLIVILVIERFFNNFLQTGRQQTSKQYANC